MRSWLNPMAAKAAAPFCGLVNSGVVITSIPRALGHAATG